MVHHAIVYRRPAAPCCLIKILFSGVIAWLALTGWVSALPEARPASTKKGVGAWAFKPINDAIRDIQVSWYYTWEPKTKGFDKPANIDFVPMIWGVKHVNPKDLAVAKANGPYLLGFNEPDYETQSNMTVEQALELWPQLMATGIILGSPATASNPVRRGGWLDRFMTGIAEKGYRVDFIAVHWYGQNFSTAVAVNQLRKFLQTIYDKYRLPVWLTEYGLVNWRSPNVYPTWEQQAAFASASVPMLETLPFLQRYAWFSLPPFESGEPLRLYEKTGNPTPVGLAYRAAAPLYAAPDEP